MKIKLKILIFSFILPGFLIMNGQDINVSLFYDQLTEALTFHCISGEYKIMSEGRELLNVEEGDILLLSREEDRIALSNNDGVIGEYPSLSFIDLHLKGRFMLKTVKPVSEQRLYKGDLLVSLKHDAVEIINSIGFSHYLAGVVEAEGGPGAPDEFFKVQAVLCRTYALKNWNRHSHEGFNICDATHCQVFHGIADDNPKILNAVLATHNIVVADKNYNLITAAYHSNSGGETQKADAVWSGEHEYLLPVIDPWSVNQPAYSWVEKLSRETWLSYLSSRGIDVEEPDDDKILIQQEHRRNNFVINKDTLRIKEVREDLGFKSSFFNMRSEGVDIIVDGKGYGHGIGLSQEGAMEMALQGFSYKDVLHFYFYDVQIKHLDELPESSVPAVFK